MSKVDIYLFIFRELLSGEWIVENVSVQQQTRNGNDCGVHVCLNAHLIASGRPLPSDSDAVDMELLRRKIAWDLVEQEIHGIWRLYLALLFIHVDIAAAEEDATFEAPPSAPPTGRNYAQAAKITDDIRQTGLDDAMREDLQFEAYEYLHLPAAEERNLHMASSKVTYARHCDSSCPNFYASWAMRLSAAVSQFHGKICLSNNDHK